jgi:D-alanyl-D-alanine carboxypeptidase
MSRLRKFILSAAVAGFVATATAAPILAEGAPEVEPELSHKLQAKLDRWRENHRAPGVAAAVRLPDGTLWIGTSGNTTVSKNSRPVEPDTPFAIASLTKTFIAATVLQLRDEGTFRLSDPISTWLPDYPKARKITLKMLLNHRSGIFDYFAHPNYEKRVFGRPRHRWSVREILSLKGPRYCRPGKCYHYSNTNYVLLGKIIKRATGRSPAKNIRKRFLQPIDLTDTFFQGLEPIGKFSAKGYWLRPGGHKGGKKVGKVKKGKRR